jgi:hypothetical protein
VVTTGGWRGRPAALWLAAWLGAVSILTLVPSAGAGATNAGRPRLTLLGQTQWVVAGSPNATAPFVLDLATRGAPAGALVSAQVYSRLRSRYDFENWVRNGSHGFPVARTGVVPLSSLPADPRTAGGSDLTLQVVQGATTPGTVVGLGCAPPTGTGTCTGVYPVEVELTGTSGSVLDRFTTFLTYQAAKSLHPLDVAIVLRLAAPVAFAAHPSGADTLGGLSAQQVSRLSATVGALRANAGVPVTVDASPETLLALDRSGATGRDAVAAFAALSQQNPATEVLPATFVPVDLGGLAAGVAPAEVTAQRQAGATTLRRLHVATASGPSTWVVTDTAQRGLGRGLAAVGADQVVVPGSDLSPTVTTATFPTVGPYAGTWTSTFDLSVGKGSGARLHAALGDTFLSGQFAHVGSDPGLAASQVLADLAMVHFERPNTTAVRGLVAITPEAALGNPIFYRVLLAGLQHDPDVTPVTLATYFSSVTVKGTRTFAQGATARSPRPSVATAISTARARLHEFDLAVHGRPKVLTELSLDLLAAESDDLSPHRQDAAVRSFRGALATQLDRVSFGKTKQTFTLTASTGWIPVTVDSRATYTLVGTLSVSGNKFIFPHGSSRTSFRMKLDHPSNLLRVHVKVRTSGDLPLHVEFTSTDGHLVIAQSLLTVRSTATSVVGIVLSAIALAILLTWWGRTWWSGRRRRKQLALASHPSSGPGPP